MKIVTEDDIFPLIASITCPFKNCKDSCLNYKHCTAPQKKLDPIERVINEFKKLHNLC